MILILEVISLNIFFTEISLGWPFLQFIDSLELIMSGEISISTLLSMSNYQLQKGLNEIKYKHKDDIKFRDKLICLIL